jgi:ferredoxin hydrogenase small subunit
MNNIPRRFILKGGLLLGGAVLAGLNLASGAVAACKELHEWMAERIGEVYKSDKSFPVRASQDNRQVRRLYKNFLGSPGGAISHRYLHMHFTDRSKNLEKLRDAGHYPNPRSAEFEGDTYPYEQRRFHRS